MTIITGSAAQAQFSGSSSSSGGCILDHCEDRAGPTPAKPDANQDANTPTRSAAPAGGGFFRRGPTASTGNFDFYVLALSWSPGFCASGGAKKTGGQCDIGSNLGFVVHGLWPQYERGFPADCDSSARAPSRVALDATKGLYPDEGLARYEWRKHGTCTGLSPIDYFTNVRAAREQVQIPAEFQQLKSEESIAPSDIARAFMTANPRLRPGMLAVGCQRGALQEIRVCFSKDLRDFRPCPEVARGSCRSSEIAVSPIR